MPVVSEPEEDESSRTFRDIIEILIVGSIHQYYYKLTNLSCLFQEVLYPIGLLVRNDAQLVHNTENKEQETTLFPSWNALLCYQPINKTFVACCSNSVASHLAPRIALTTHLLTTYS